MANMTNAALTPAPEPEEDAVIGRNVDYLIWRNRDKQATVATALGMSAQSLSHKLKGRRPWTSREIKSAARRYGVTIDSLFELPGFEPKQQPSDYSAEGSVIDLFTRADVIPA